MGVRWGAGLIIAILIVSAAKAQEPAQTPVLKLFLDPNMPSESVEVRYALYGAFGSSSSFVKAGPGPAYVEIPLAVQGAVAGEIRVFAWSPGCRMVKFDIRIEGLDVRESYPCNRLSSVTLAGQVEGSLLKRHQEPVEIRVDYLAGWGCEFFGFADCMVPQFSVGTVKIDPLGHFEIRLPDFASDPACKDSTVLSGFQIALRSKNEVTILTPTSSAVKTSGGLLKQASKYPDPITFVEVKPD